MSATFYIGLLFVLAAAFGKFSDAPAWVIVTAFIVGLVLVFVGLLAEPGTLPQVKGNKRGIRQGTSDASMSGELLDGNMKGKQP